MSETELLVLSLAGLWSIIVGIQVLRGHWLRLVRGNLFGRQTESLKQGGTKFAGWFYIALGAIAEVLYLGARFFGWQ